MNIPVINAEVVFKPIKIPVASDPGRRKVAHDICADHKEEESGQAGRYSASFHTVLGKSYYALVKRSSGLDCIKKIEINQGKKERNPPLSPPKSLLSTQIPPTFPLEKTERCRIYLLEIRFKK